MKYRVIALLVVAMTIVPIIPAQDEAVASGETEEQAQSESPSHEDQWYQPVLDAGFNVLSGILVAVLGVVGIFFQRKIKELAKANKKLDRLLPPTIDDPLNKANARHLITAVFLGESNCGKSELVGSLIGSDKKRVRTETVNRHYGVWGAYYDPKDPEQNLSMEPGARAVRESYWLDLFDSVGQDYGLIIDHLLQRRESFSKHIVLVVVVDLFSGPIEEETLPISVGPESKRIKAHLKRFDEQFVEQFRGVLGDIYVQQVVVFVNKVDGIRERTNVAKLKVKFRDIGQSFSKYGYPVKTIVGSALTGEGMVELRYTLRQSAEEISG